MSRLTETLENDLAKLEADGIKLTPEELIWLNDLARTVENPQGRTVAFLAGSPISAGGFYFWTLTLQSSLWFRDVACRHFTDETMLHRALGFASVFGRDEYLPAWADAKTFEQLNSEPSAKKTVKQFARRFRGNKKELESALFRLMPDIDAPYPLPKEESPDLDDDSILADLLAGTGLSREYWQRQHSPFVLKTLVAMYKQAAVAAGAEGEADQEYKAAFMEYDKALKVCRDAHLKEQDDGAE